MGQFQNNKLDIPQGESSSVVHDSATSLLPSGSHDPITPIPSAESYKPTITPLLASMNPTGGEPKQFKKYETVIRAPELQQKLTNYVSGPEENYPITEPIRIIHWEEYINNEGFRAIDSLFSAYMNYSRKYKAPPEYLCISAKHFKEVEEDMENNPFLSQMLPKIIFDENVRERKVFFTVIHPSRLEKQERSEKQN